MTVNRVYNWDGYLQLARDYFAEVDDEDNAQNETKIRCGISRAYYAVFHVSKKYLERKGISLPYTGGSSHDKVISLYKQLYNTSKIGLYKKIHEELSRLKTERVKADYNDVLIPFSNYQKSSKKKILERVIKQVDKALYYFEEIEKIDNKNGN